MKIEVGKTYVTRGGSLVKMVAALDPAKGGYAWVGVLDNTAETFTLDGRYHANEPRNFNADIVSEYVPPKPRLLAYICRGVSTEFSSLRYYSEGDKAPSGLMRAPWLDEPEAK